MPRPLARSKERAISRLQGAEGQIEVANFMDVAISTMCRLWKRFQATRNIHDAHRTVRSRMTSLRQDRAIPRNHQGDSFGYTIEMAWTTIGSHERAISGQSERHRLRRGPRLCCRPSRHPIPTARHSHQLLVWAQHHLKWTWQQWRNVRSTDESTHGR